MTSTDRGYFDRMYENDPDPWGFETSPYEARKYAVTLASLPRDHYGSAFEPGCSIGVLTQLLAPRCGHLLATDFMAGAVDVAQRRLAAYPHVDVEVRSIPSEWPAGPFDLVVLSEIAYYFDRADLEHIVRRVREVTTVGAHVIGVHWRGRTDYPLSGDRAHEVISVSPWLHRVVHHEEREFVLTVWERVA
jgi:cyclopropane fatty-acyl-phospholipid synthase-like methyltransferase